MRDMWGIGQAAPMSFLLIALYASGMFCIVLGVLHFTFPARFGFLAALSEDSSQIPPFRLWFYRYDLRRSDLRGVVYVMNHCVSYVIVSAGVCDLFAARWLGTFAGASAAAFIAGLWFIRASTQFYLGRRKGDWFVFGCFSFLGALHITAALHT